MEVWLNQRYDGGIAALRRRFWLPRLVEGWRSSSEARNCSSQRSSSKREIERERGTENAGCATTGEIGDGMAMKFACEAASERLHIIYSSVECECDRDERSSFILEPAVFRRGKDQSKHDMLRFPP